MPLARGEKATAALTDSEGSSMQASFKILANHQQRVILVAAPKGGIVITKRPGQMLGASGLYICLQVVNQAKGFIGSLKEIDCRGMVTRLGLFETKPHLQ